MTENPVQKRENIWISLGFNLALPIFFLRKGAEWFGSSLGEILGVNEDSTLVGAVLLLVAISFPIGYGIWDLLKRKKWNFISILGALSVLLTGGIGLIPGATVQMFAIKEAALPAVLGLFVIISLKSKTPLIRLILYNTEVIRVELVEERLQLRNTKSDFDQLLVKCTWLIALTFVLSATLNYFLAKWIVVTEPSIDMIAYNDEVGKMMGWSFPIISIPCMLVSAYAFWLLIRGIQTLTGLKLEEALAQGLEKSK